MPEELRTMVFDRKDQVIEISLRLIDSCHV